jgi:hypothetical protein
LSDEQNSNKEIDFSPEDLSGLRKNPAKKSYELKIFWAENCLTNNYQLCLEKIE